MAKYKKNISSETMQNLSIKPMDFIELLLFIGLLFLFSELPNITLLINQNPHILLDEFLLFGIFALALSLVRSFVWLLDFSKRISSTLGYKVIS